MKFTINKNELLKNLNIVIKAISSKNVIPILNGIMFDLKNDGLELTASDSELTIKTFINKENIINIEQTGSVIVPSKFILDIIRKMPNEEINFELFEGYKLKIYTDVNNYNLNCFDASEFPVIKIEESKTPLNFVIKDFKQMIEQTVFAISTQELRPLLTGVNIHIVNNIMDVVATDSYRLAKKTVKLEKAVNDEINIIIPGKNLLELLKTFDDLENNIEIHIFNNKIIFKFNNVLFQSNLLNGTYPNTSNLIPTEFTITTSVDVSNYNAAIDRASLLTQGKDKNVVIMNIKNNNMLITSYASELGKVEEKLTVEASENANISISFSAKYMMEALKTFDDEKILILLNSDVKPIVIKSIENDDLIQLILPIKTY